MNAVVPHGHDFRSSTDAAGLCGKIVTQTASKIQGKRYVSVEGWQAIAIAHGCAASALEVERVNDEGMTGFKCVGVVRRMEDGQEIARAEGFLGDDENTWNKRPVYARRAMVQTRAISRACRSAFAHVVVMIDAGLSTTPAEEVPEGGFIEGRFREGQVSQDEAADRRKVEPIAGETVTQEYAFPEGPATGITQLKAMARNLWREIEGCGDDSELDPLLATDDNKAIMKQLAALENPAHRTIWEGDGGDNPGIAGLIIRKQAEFAQQLEPNILQAG